MGGSRISAMKDALLQSNLPLPVRRGKVRDVYDLGDSLLIVATDRISAYDVVMPNGIPEKGRILTALSLFWFEKFGRDFENHLIATDVNKYQKTQTVCGVRLPAGLRQCDKLPQAIFTPATKEEEGHDINISYEEMVN